MDRRKRNRQCQRSGRSGFTLIELLVVILIIGILMSLLVPAVIASIKKAREAQVTAEMNNLSAALASFKNLYGDYPPSRIILVEQGYGSLTTAQLSAVAGPVTPDGTSTDMSVQQLVARSQIYLNRIWPRVDFINGHYDFNGDTVIATNNGVAGQGYFILSGSECLTFFLGGLAIHNADGTYAMSGFSRSPLNPFQPSSSGQTNRIVPMYEFVAGRLIDQDHDGFPSYIDPLNNVPGARRAYAYFFSYGANAYDPNDDNGYGHNFDGSTSVDDPADFEQDAIQEPLAPSIFTEWGFQTTFPLSTGSTGIAVSPAPNPYTTTATAGTTVSYVNPTTFQILSSGQDGYWGLGGTYSGAGGPTLPQIYKTTPGNANFNLDRSRENDNITNFTTSRLN